MGRRRRWKQHDQKMGDVLRTSGRMVENMHLGMVQTPTGQVGQISFATDDGHVLHAVLDAQTVTTLRNRLARMEAELRNRKGWYGPPGQNVGM